MGGGYGEDTEGDKSLMMVYIRSCTRFVCNTVERLSRSANCVASQDLPKHRVPVIKMISGTLWW